MEFILGVPNTDLAAPLSTVQGGSQSHRGGYRCAFGPFPVRQQILLPFQPCKMSRFVYWCPNWAGSHQGTRGAVVPKEALYTTLNQLLIWLYITMLISGKKQEALLSFPLSFRYGGPELKVCSSSNINQNLMHDTNNIGFIPLGSCLYYVRVQHWVCNEQTGRRIIFTHRQGCGGEKPWISPLTLYSQFSLSSLFSSGQSNQRCKEVVDIPDIYRLSQKI